MKGEIMNKDAIRQWVNLITAILTIFVNALANALPLNGQTTGEISDRFRVYFVPAGYVFSIWGLIYIGWLAFAIYQFLPTQRQNPRLRRIGYLFAVSGLANIAWLFLWHYEVFVLTLLAMFTLLGVLIAIYLRLRIGRVSVPTVERWCVDIPFSIYLGWITVATVANVTAVLDYLRWDGWGLRPEVWALIMLAATFAIAASVGFTRRDVAYLLVIIWAVVGIAVKHAGVPAVAAGAWVTAGLVALILVIVLLSARRSR